MSILLTIAFEAKPDRLTAFLELLAAVKSELPGTAGCEDIRILQNVDEPTSISLIETWGSRVEHQAHVEAIVATGGWDHVMSHLAPAGESLFSGGLAPSCDGGREMNCRTSRSHHRDSRSSPIMHVAQ
ncbi:putative quinol monooxygenase (plasmid) [Rhizobium leguminosarum]